MSCARPAPQRVSQVVSHTPERPRSSSRAAASVHLDLGALVHLGRWGPHPPDWSVPDEWRLRERCGDGL